MEKQVKTMLTAIISALVDRWQETNDGRYQRLAEKILKAFNEEFGE